jgi:hypothetical protein
MFNLEDTLNELENDFKEVNKMKFGLLSATLEPFDFLYQDTNGEKTYEVMEKSQKDDNCFYFRRMIYYLYLKRSKFDEGVKKVKKYYKRLGGANINPLPLGYGCF